MNTPAKQSVQRSPGRWLSRLGLLIFIIVVLGPLLALLAETIPALAEGNSSWLLLALPSGRRLSLLANSVGLACSVAAGDIGLGVLGGLVLWRWDKGRLSRLRWLVLIAAPVPAYIQALAWTSVAGSLNSFGLNLLPSQGFAAAWWIELMAYAPLSVGLTLLGLKSLEPAFVDSARVVRSDFTALRNIILPLAAPAILAGGGVLFILSLLDYSVPSLVNFNVYSLEIFAEYSSSNEPVRAFLLSLPVMAVAVTVLVLVLSALRNAASSPSWHATVWKTGPVFPSWLKAAQWLGIGFLSLQFVVPVILVFETASLSNLTSNILSARNEIWYSLWLDTAVSLICIPLALATARLLVKSTRRSTALWITVAAPLAIPPALTGIGLISIWNRPMAVDVYGSALMPVLAGAARFAPLAVIIMVAQFRSIDPQLIEAARVFQKNSWQTLRYVWLPMFIPGLTAAFGVVFALTLGELGATLLVAPPGHSTLTIRIYNLLHYGASGTVAGLCLVMLAAVVLAAAGAAAAMSRWSNLNQPAGER